MKSILFFSGSVLQLGLEPNSQLGRAGKRDLDACTWELHGTPYHLQTLVPVVGGRVLRRLG